MREKSRRSVCARVKADFPPAETSSPWHRCCARQVDFYAQRRAHTLSQDSTGSWLLIGCARRACASVSAPFPRASCPCAPSHIPVLVTRRLRYLCEHYFVFICICFITLPSKRRLLLQSHLFPKKQHDLHNSSRLKCYSSLQKNAHLM